MKYLITFILFFNIFSNAQILTTKQEGLVKETIRQQFGTSSEHAIYNLGHVNFVSINDQLYYTPTGFNYVYKISGDSLIRLDHSYFHGNNHNRLLFSWKGKIYTLGGYGFFVTNNNLTYFNFQTAEWCYEPVKGEIPPFILGVNFRQGDFIYSFNNYKAGNNAESDKIDSCCYRLNLNSMTWQKIAFKNKPTFFPTELYLSQAYCFAHGRNRSIIVSLASLAYLEINNDAFGISSNAYVTFIKENTLTFSKHDNNEKFTSVDLDLNKTWKENKDRVKSFEVTLLNEKKVNRPLFNFKIILAIILSILLLIYIYYRRIGASIKIVVTKKTSNPEAGLKQELGLAETEAIKSILESNQDILSTDELDELLKISHLEQDSKKLKRHRILNEIQKISPNLVTRIKDVNDKRRFIYKINR